MNFRPIHHILPILLILTGAPLSLLAAPANDAFARRAASSATKASFRITDFHTATVEAGEPGRRARHSVWYQWTAAKDGIAVMETTNSQFTCRIDVFHGASLSNLVTIVSAKSSTPAVEIPVTSGSTYIIRYSAENIPSFNQGKTGWFHVSLRTNTAYNGVALLRPATARNDLFSKRVPISADTRVIAYNASATREGGEPRDSGERTVWYEWIAPADGYLGATVLEAVPGKTNHTLLSVFEGSPGGAIQELTRVGSAKLGRDLSPIHVSAGRSYSFSIASTYSYSDYSFIHSFSISHARLPSDITATTPRFKTRKVNRGSTEIIRITNTGGSPLTKLSMRLSGAASRDFSLGIPSKVPLNPGETATLGITFKPRAKGTRRAILVLLGDEAAIAVPLAGRGE